MVEGLNFLVQFRENAVVTGFRYGDHSVKLGVFTFFGSDEWVRQGVFSNVCCRRYRLLGGW